MRLSAEAKALAARLGHDFRDPSLLIRALTHGSAMSAADNERLEFLGDRVLGLAMAHALFDADKTATEGQLAPRYNALVRRESCADVAREIDLGQALKLGRSEQKTGGRRKEALLADAMEAVVAAIYLDAGFEAARASVLRLWDSRIGSVEVDARDAKTALQEWAQARGEPPPDYVEVGARGPAAPAGLHHRSAADGRANRAGDGRVQARRGTRRRRRDDAKPRRLTRD